MEYVLLFVFMDMNAKCLKDEMKFKKKRQISPSSKCEVFMYN